VDKTYTWTVDVESDWGGRTNGALGIKEGLPAILEIFRAHNIKALFFVSSESALDNRGSINRIVEQGHEIGSHGHFHIRYKEAFRAAQDREISERLLSIFSDKALKYRAPWFYYQAEDSIYSYRNNHVSVLRHAWFGGKIPAKPIFYIHPFDIVKGQNAPNLFTRILYAKPKIVLDTFTELVRAHPGHSRLR